MCIFALAKENLNLLQCTFIIAEKARRANQLQEKCKMPPSRPILSGKRFVRTNFGRSESDKYFFARIHAGEFDLWTFPLRACSCGCHLRDCFQFIGLRGHEVQE